MLNDEKKQKTKILIKCSSIAQKTKLNYFFFRNSILAGQSYICDER